MYRLLIVDDEYEIRNGLCRYFPWDEVGFTVVGQAENARDALSFLQSNPVDLVLCDIMMPGMSGLELAEKINAEFPSVYVCILTAYKDFSYAQQAVSLNVLKYILKSSSSSELLSIFRSVQATLDKKRTEQSAVDIPMNINSNSYKDSNDNSSTTIVSREAQLIFEVQEYVQKNYVSVDLISAAENIHMSPNYVSKIFKNITGQNFSDYVLKVRMEKALELLRDPHTRIYEVGDKIGYNYVKNFSRAFKDYFGISPREFRNGNVPTRNR